MSKNSSRVVLNTIDLSVGYRGKSLIRDISIEVKKGEILTLIGPNGAGKSTILKTIAAQLESLTGQVYLDGCDMRNMSRAEVAKGLSMMMTKQPVTEFMTCRDVVATGRYPYTGRLGILAKEDWEKVEAAMERVHATEVADRDFMQLSDGQRQRVLLAKALCQEPEVLILDEPTSFLDVRYKMELLSILRKIVREEEMSVIMSLHELDLARRISDRIVCIKGDAVDRVGRPEEIFRDNYIDTLYGIESGHFDPVSGVAQLERVEGKAQVFVIGGGGSALDLYYSLQRQGIPFASGILGENDMEAPVAQVLAEKVFLAEAFCEPAESILDAAKRKIDSCDRVYCVLEKFGPYNRYNQVLAEYAESCGKLADKVE